MIKRLSKSYSKYSLFLLFWLISVSLSAQKAKILYGPTDAGITYTSLEEALQSPTNVYRLKLTSLPCRDSLPEELFRLTELRELTVKGCRLCTVNARIGEFKHLQYLNLDRNKLVRLPETLGNLHDLRMLIISRNMIEILPESTGNLTNLASIDAWDNPMYVLPERIKLLKNTLKTIDLRQIPLRKSEFLAMQELLPNTDILFTDICECENRRDHD